MKQESSHNHRLIFRTARRTLTRCAALAAVACTSDPFDDPNTPTNRFAFDIAVPEAWVDGDGAPHGTIRELAVERMAQTERAAEPLYLVTQVSETEPTDGATTRGTQIGTTEAFHDTFGLSAVCYGGTFPEGAEAEKLRTDAVAHDVKMARATKEGPWDTADGSKILHPGSGNLRFYAYAPYADDTRLGGALRHEPARGTSGLPRIVYTVPDAAQKQLDIMTARTDYTGTGSGAVRLAFGHALTAVTLQTGDEMLGGKVTSVTLEGVYGSGSHTIGSDAWTPSGSVRTFTLERATELPDTDDDNVYTKPGSPIVGGEYTFMMIPQTLPAGAKLVVGFTDNLTGRERTLTASLAGKKWPVGRRVTYSISSTGIAIRPTFKLESTSNAVQTNGLIADARLTAYAVVAQEGEKDPVTLRLPYRLEYACDGGEWTTGSWLSDESAPTDPTKTMQGRLLLKRQSSFEALRAPFEAKKQLTEAGLGTAEVPHDLAKEKETANCYIVQNHGYYSLPAVYGNARSADGSPNTAAYTYQGALTDADPTDAGSLADSVLVNFVGHDNLPIAGPDIPNIADAVLLWQDAPDLVTDVHYDADTKTIRFRVPKETLTQGNAVIAVRNASKTILWSWHIWATHYVWDGTQDLGVDVPTFTDGRVVDGDPSYDFAPCNLGYCDRHEGDEQHTFRVRCTFILPDGKKSERSVVLEQEFVQPAVPASAAGDNPYYQWGRKDPMLPGIHNKQTQTMYAGSYSYPDPNKDDHPIVTGNYVLTQFNMTDKPCYTGAEYRLTAADTEGKTIGDGILQPYCYFLHTYPEGTPTDVSSADPEKKEIAKFHLDLRVHWHHGIDAAYHISTVLNYWNSQCNKHCRGDHTSNYYAYPNGMHITKSIYDPCPAGYHVPAPNAFARFGTTEYRHASADGSSAADPNNVANNQDKYPNGCVRKYENGILIGWELDVDRGNSAGNKIFFPATGLRDMGMRISAQIPPAIRESGLSWPAHSELTFVTTASLGGSGVPQSMLFYLDSRTDSKNRIYVNGKSNNAYGFTVRPVHE